MCFRKIILNLETLSVKTHCITSLCFICFCYKNIFFLPNIYFNRIIDNNNLAIHSHSYVSSYISKILDKSIFKVYPSKQTCLRINELTTSSPLGRYSVLGPGLDMNLLMRRMLAKVPLAMTASFPLLEP